MLRLGLKGSGGLKPEVVTLARKRAGLYLDESRKWPIRTAPHGDSNSGVSYSLIFAARSTWFCQHSTVDPLGLSHVLLESQLLRQRADSLSNGKQATHFLLFPFDMFALRRRFEQKTSTHGPATFPPVLAFR
ncbi:predicted protein [Pyrenophora tritici-repentis Pt-1C-BFP]|uniref:Uncharacterized protein n=1 Tax=Pyrenophora tritici-repentis (strain Pt-1C-BFP) TaxID=426418 RepID=B2WLN0_PYRTR|nr:uncharacterized protein PTRG_10890 [Pyrenophora tritici-repentis Pt-1C-BFP]EDU43940.1 predicted protein [Pyrenophora tritici-repentis Pt-1C-BFP]